MLGFVWCKIMLDKWSVTSVNIGAICCDPRSGIDKYSPINERKNRVKHKVAKPPSVFHEVFSRVWSEYLKFC